MESGRAVPPQVRRLIEAATALRSGTSTYFPLTRLTNAKRLCREPEAAARFVFYLAERTLERMQVQQCPPYTDPADWTRYQALVSDAVVLIRRTCRHHPSRVSANCAPC